MLIYTLRRFGRFISRVVIFNEQLYYTKYASDAMEFENPESAAKFVVDHDLHPHEIVPIAIKYADEKSLPKEKRLYFSKEDQNYRQ